MRPVDIVWEGGEHPFALPLGYLRAVQDRCNAGPMMIYRRLQDGSYRVDDALAPIEFGLMGGGMERSEAKDLVRRIADASPLAAFVVPATLVMAAAIVGVPDDPVGEGGDSEGKPEGATSAPTAAGGSRGSTRKAPKPASRRAKSTK